MSIVANARWETRPVTFPLPSTIVARMSMSNSFTSTADSATSSDWILPSIPHAQALRKVLPPSLDPPWDFG
jgi:hypothetical protein